MASTREQNLEAAHTGEPPPETPSTLEKSRRPLVILLAIIMGVLVYAVAFEQTEVSLETITSETRQESLTRILRLLARPDLVTYETEEDIVSTEIAIPCGPSVAGSGRLTITPSCAEPGDTVTVTGTGFDAREDVDIEFVPDSEFAITLRLADITTGPDGDFSVEIELPDRTSDDPQVLQAVTQERIGSWGNRVEVYTDANDNGVEDDPILGDSGTLEFELSGNPDAPAVALLNPAAEVTQFVSVGDSFEAVAGVARGQISIPLEEAATTNEGEVQVVAIDGGNVTIEAAPGFDLAGWRASLYDGTTGEPVTSAATPITDTIELSPRISDTVETTWDKILETVFLALIATTAGLLLAVPLSFIAARNIMREISVTVTNLALVLIAVPIGGVAGLFVARGAQSLVDPLGDNWLGLLGSLALVAVATFFLARAGLPVEETEIPTRADKVRRGVFLVLAGALGLVGLLLVSRLLQLLGNGIAPVLGLFGFLGTFFADIGEILDVALSLIAALAAAGVFANLASRLGYGIRSRTPRPLLRTLNAVFSALAGALWAVLIAQVIDWFYLLQDPTLTVWIPAAVGALAGLLVSWRGMAKGEVDVGLSIYYAARTVFNTLRSIEPLVMAIVFVVWVGLGPFAGALALALHTAAALAKLYSEQVESISPGPIEAVRATGANRMQTIIYAVVPQIVPPYISFTMYRWDINVRMSTIIGFVGGGGIGSILQQNINLLDYRAASVQMLAIALVVASMDYASSRLRERYV